MLRDSDMTEESGAVEPVHQATNSKTRTSKSFFGTTIKGLTRRAGWLMLNVEKWWREERSYGTTGAGISLSIFLVSVAIGLYFGLRLERGKFSWDGKEYVMVGVGCQQDGVCVPVYQELKQ